MHGSGRTVAPVANATRLLVAFVAFGFVATACGGSDFSRRGSAPGAPAAPVPAVTVRNPTLQSVLLRAVALTDSGGTARTSISVTLTGLGNGSVSSGAFDVAGTGVVDLRTGNADLELSVPRFDRLGSRGPIEQRIVSGVTYVKAPAAVVKAGGLPTSVHWLSLDAESIEGVDPGALSQLHVDPAGQLAFLGAVSQNVRRIGSDPVRGVPATHYTATIDVPTSLTRATTAAQKVAALGSVIGTARLTVDAWLDAGGRARRIVVSAPLSKAVGTLRSEIVGSQATMRIQADLFAFGVQVRVAAPPHAQIRPYGTLRIPAAKG